MRTAWEQHSNESPRAAVELTAREAAALADALSFYLRRRFVGGELELIAQALSLRSFTELSDRLGALTTAGAGGRLLLSEQELRGLREALCLYLAERDTESYQPPEERERLAELHEINEPLGDLLTVLPKAPAGSETLSLR
jgi:hypothetical protein